MTVVFGLLLLHAAYVIADDVPRVTPIPAQLKQKLDLDPVYKKYVSANGFPLLASEDVSDFALREAAYLIGNMLHGRDDIRDAMIANKTRFVVMAAHEFTTDVPEHSDLQPSRYWDRRARGLGATHERPVVSCGEENLLCYKGDHYSTENILIHEFAHAMHEMGLDSIDKAFDRRLKAAFDEALAAGLWKGTYAATNHKEYWAEGVQSWFDTNRPKPDDQHNHVDTREELKEYDAKLAALIEAIYGDRAWRYVRPDRRSEAWPLAGF
ncbi:MAG: hypothetical protein IID42_08470, partial [Planctomycetes bacterium]|nr:hypothetical protein [Planctomycetota bacterium]